MTTTLRYAKCCLPILVMILALPVDAAQTTIQANEISSVDVDALFANLTKINFWLVLGVTLVFGALGGFVYELLALQGMIERRHKPDEEEVKSFPHAIHKFVYDLGVWARLIIGGTAAVVALWIIAPKSTFAWLAIAIIAGSAGTSIFQSMQDRLLAVIKSKEVADLETELQGMGEQLQKIEEAVQSGDNVAAERLTFAARAMIDRTTGA